MSTTVEERVLHLKFDNLEFERGIKKTLMDLDALKKGLNLDGATKGLTDLNRAGRAVKLDHIADQVDGIASRFSAMGIAAVTALATIAHQAFAAGQALVSSLTIDPIRTGLQEYEINLNSIQTILSNTVAAGVTLEQVNDALQELNLYSDQTIYNFAQMAKNIGTFTAAGIALEPAVAAIKGIANLAALSGSNSEQAAMAMYQLSQALAAGRVALIDWNSVVNAGMGGTVFQRALAQTAVVMGKLSSSAVTLSGDMQTVKINGEAFRNSLQDGWLTADVLTNTLAQFTGDLTDAELAAQGFNQTQIDAIQAQARSARAAATEVKTLTQTLGALREAAGSGWAQTWQIIVGNFTEAKELWSEVYNAMDSIIGGAARRRNELLMEWKELGGRAEMIQALKNAFKALGAILKPIGEAWRQVFPRSTAKELFSVTKAVREFTETLMPSEQTLNNLRRTFAGIFAVVGIGWEIVKQLARVLFNLFNVARGGSGDILEVTASIGDFLVAMHQAVQDGTWFTRFFDGLGAVLAVPIRLLQGLGTVLSKLFDRFDPGAAADKVDQVAGAIEPFGFLGQTIIDIWDAVVHSFDDLWSRFEPLASRLANFFHEFGNSISTLVGDSGLDQMIAGINTGLLAYLVFTFTRLFGRHGVINDARQILDNVNDTLNTMQNTLRAATLLQIALAIGILTLSVYKLSQLDPNAVAASLGAIAVMLTELIAALLVLERMPAANTARLYAMAGAMIVLGIAIRVLVSSVVALSKIDPRELHRGLIATAILIGAVVAAARFLPPNASLVSTGTGLLILSIGIKVLASAVEDISRLSWSEIARGLVGVGALLAALTLFTRLANVNAGGVLTGVGIILLAAGIKILASAMKDISTINWENVGKGMTVLAVSLALMTAALMLIPPTAPLQAAGVAIVAAAMLILAEAMKSISGINWENIGKGMAVLATSLLLIGAALYLIPPTAPLSAAGVLIVALALEILADVFKKLAKMSWEDFGKSMAFLAGGLGIITGALMLMPAALPGAFALLIVAGALTILAFVLKTIAELSWGEIIKGLATLAGVFIVLGLAGLVLQPVVPALLGLAGAVALIGIGLALAGAGVFLFATGLTLLSAAGGAATVVIVAFLSSVIGLIPMLVEQVGIALILLIQVIAEAAPQIVEAIVIILIQVLDGLITLLPKVFEVIGMLLEGIIALAVEYIPKLQQAGLKILISLLKGIRDNIGEIVTLVIDIISEFLRALGRKLPDLVDAGFDMIISIMEGITKAIDDNAEEIGEAGADLAWALIEGVVRGLGAFGHRIKDKLLSLARSAWDAALDFLDINSPSKKMEWMGEMSGEGLVNGLDNMIPLVEKSAEGVANSALISLRNSLVGLGDVFTGDMDLQPVITPVLDLTDIRREAGQIGNLLASSPIEVDVTRASANAALAGFQDNRDTEAENENDSSGTTFNYTQNITSPKAVSTAEVYRQTNNQLSTVRGGLPS